MRNLVDCLEKQFGRESGGEAGVGTPQVVGFVFEIVGDGGAIYPVYEKEEVLCVLKGQNFSENDTVKLDVGSLVIGVGENARRYNLHHFIEGVEYGPEVIPPQAVLYNSGTLTSPSKTQSTIIRFCEKPGYPANRNEVYSNLDRLVAGLARAAGLKTDWVNNFQGG